MKMKALDSLLGAPWSLWITRDVSLLSYTTREQSKILGLLFMGLGISISDIDELNTMRTIWFGRLLDLTVYQIMFSVHEMLNEGITVIPEAQDFYARCKRLDRVVEHKREIRQTDAVYEEEMSKIRKTLGAE